MSSYLELRFNRFRILVTYLADDDEVNDVTTGHSLMNLYWELKSFLYRRSPSILRR